MIQVAAGVIIDRERVLIAQRSSKDQMGSKWEFPGGKIERGESPRDCLKREMLEEFGVTVKVGDFFLQTRYDYGCFSVELFVYWIDEFDGDFELDSHDQIKWVFKRDLNRYDFLEADKAIISKLMCDRDIIQSKS